MEEREGTQEDEAAGPPPTEGGTSGRSATRPRGAGQRRIHRRKRRTTRKGVGMGIPQGGHMQKLSLGRGVFPPPEKKSDLSDFTPESAHLLLRGVYGDYPHHSNGSHLYRGVVDDTIWQHRWRQLVAQSASWYARLSGAVGRRLTKILAAEWRGVLGRTCNFERPTLMGPIEETLREKFFPALFGGEEINTDFQQILGHSINRGGYCILDPRLSVESAYNTSKADSGEKVYSILGGNALNYVGHGECVCRESAGARK